MSSSGWPPADPEDVDRMQENLIAYFRLFAGLPGVNFVEEDFTWSVGAPGPHILRTRIPGDDVDRRIDDIVSRLGQYTDQFDWFVFGMPSCGLPQWGKASMAGSVSLRSISVCVNISGKSIRKI